jgi:hypothetical protein
MAIDTHPGSTVDHAVVRDRHRYAILVFPDDVPVLRIDHPIDGVSIDLYCIDVIAAMQLAGLDVTWNR